MCVAAALSGPVGGGGGREEMQRCPLVFGGQRLWLVGMFLLPLNCAAAIAGSVPFLSPSNTS